MENNDDRRKFPRFNLLVDVSVTKRASSEKEKILPSKNISQGGVCVIAVEQPKMGDLMDLKIRLPGMNDDIKIMGKVVWVREFSIGATQRSQRFEVGMEFIGLSDTTFELINKYLYNSHNG
jgi:hypothetical protein